MDSQIKQYIEIFQSKKQIIENKQKEIDKLNDQFQKIIIPLNEDLVQSQEELNQFAQNIKFTLTLQELSQIIAKATKTNFNQISSYINYAQTILSNNDDIFVKAPLTINYFIYNKKTRKSLFKGSYIANILDTQADGKTLYQHTILKINSKYEYTMIYINSQNKENLFIQLSLKQLNSEMCQAILNYLNKKEKTLIKTNNH